MHFSDLTSTLKESCLPAVGMNQGQKCKKKQVLPGVEVISLADYFLDIFPLEQNFRKFKPDTLKNKNK